MCSQGHHLFFMSDNLEFLKIKMHREELFFIICQGCISNDYSLNSLHNGIGFLVKKYGFEYLLFQYKLRTK